MADIAFVQELAAAKKQAGPPQGTDRWWKTTKWCCGRCDDGYQGLYYGGRQETTYPYPDIDRHDRVWCAKHPETEMMEVVDASSSLLR